MQALLADPAWGDSPKFVLGGGSNIVLTGDVKPLVLKVEVPGAAWWRRPQAWSWKPVPVKAGMTL